MSSSTPAGSAQSSSRLRYHDSETSINGSGSGAELRGGLTAEDDLAVKVVDFPNGSAVESGQEGGKGKDSRARTPPPPRRVDPPQGTQAWENFIDQYAAGQAHHLDFSVDTSQASSNRRRSVLSNKTATPNPLHPIANAQGSSKPLGQTASPLNLERQGISSREHDSSSPYSSADEMSSSSQHRITSAAGQVNQDPSIPNISGHSSDAEKNAERRAEQQAGGTEAQALTREHMAQMRIERKEAADEADAEDSPEGRREDGHRRASSPTRSKRRIRTRRPVDAELGSARAAHSMASSASSEDVEIGASSRGSRTSRKSRPPLPSSKRSFRASRSSVQEAVPQPMADFLADSGSAGSASQPDINFSYTEDRERVREFFDKHGYMPAPRQTPDALRRRLRVIRRLGLEHPDELHRTSLDRFTRLAVSIFKTKRALVSIIGRDRQIFLSEIGMGAKSTSFEDAFCCHTVIGDGESCMVIPDAARDWRFTKNPLVKGGAGIVQFYAGAPLRVGQGAKAAIIGSMCIIDDTPRQDFGEEGQRLLQDLAECVVSELELLYNQRATIEAAKLHQINFLRRSLKHRPTERAGRSRQTATTTSATKSSNVYTDTTGSTASSSGGKRNSGADSKQREEDIDIFDEACQEIRLALAAHAVAIVDLSQFHLFYPSYQTSTTRGSVSGGGSQSFDSQSRAQSFHGQSSRSYTASAARGEGEEAEPYQKAADGKAARLTYAVVDPMSAGRTPQVLFVPSNTSTSGRMSDNVPKAAVQNSLPILGYSCHEDNFAFNFSATPAGRKIVCDFIARNVKGRTVWYSRDDSEGVAESITHLMPPGTEASLAMPVFGYDGQVAFAVVGCWTDPLFSYPAGALQFVETIAGSLLASVMKERLHQAERAQLNFAAAASHELRTPLHQLNAAAALLRQCLQPSLIASPVNSPLSSPSATMSLDNVHPDPISTAPHSRHQSQGGRLSRYDRKDAAAQLEVIEANGVALGQILENIIDTLDIGRAISTGKNGMDPSIAPLNAVPEEMHDLTDVLENVVKDAILQESKSRRVAGEQGLENVEILLEVMPRMRGRWLLATDPGPLSRVLSKIVNNACKFTEKGYIHITVQDASREVSLPGGYDNSIKLSQVVIDVKDTGRGMSPDFLDQTFLRPFAKADPFKPGAGLGLGLAQRMIEILGGKLGIKSTLGKGTLVHIELPLHLLNIDNDSDLDDLIQQNENFTIRYSTLTRQDGILLTGFDTGDAGLRRVGRTLVRQLKLRLCRVVDNPQFASLIVLPEGQFSDDEIKGLARTARPGVEIISLLSSKQALSTTRRLSEPSLLAPSTGRRSSEAPDLGTDLFKVTYLARPLFPSIIRRIVQVPKRVEPPNEVYVSEVVGGDEAREERAAGGGDGGSTRGGGSLADVDGIASTAHPSILGSPGLAGSAVALSDKWSTSSSADDKLNAQGDGIPPLSPTGIIKDLVASPGESDQPQTNAPGPLLLQQMALMTVQAPKGESTEASDSGVTGQPGAMKVLVVEDNAVNRRIVVAMLKRTACHYAEAVDGEDAVRQFRAFAPAIVFLDINMPKMDGFQAATEMRKIETKRGDAKRAKIIAVTALSQEASKRRGLIECGIDEWRTKPVSLKTLKDDVERIREL